METMLMIFGDDQILGYKTDEDQGIIIRLLQGDTSSFQLFQI